MDERRKTCFRCVQSKPIGESYGHPMMDRALLPSRSNKKAA